MCKRLYTQLVAELAQLSKAPIDYSFTTFKMTSCAEQLAIRGDRFSIIVKICKKSDNAGVTATDYAAAATAARQQRAGSKAVGSKAQPGLMSWTLQRCKDIPARSIDQPCPTRISSPRPETMRQWHSSGLFRELVGARQLCKFDEID